ncbi:MAG: hypothetical protein AAF500_21185 [Myxococcota bacterium]
MRSGLLLALTVLLAVACGDGRFPGTAGNESALVGGPCMDNSDCDFQLCESFDNLPGGICTLSCENDNDCPSGSSCAGLETGWVCLLNCESTSDCREQWTCEAVARPQTGEEDPGSFQGCIGPPLAS